MSNLYTIHNIDISIINQETNDTVTFDTVDSIDITDSITKEVVYPKARSSNPNVKGITQLSGGEVSDEVVLISTFINESLATILQSIATNPKGNYDLVISGKDDPNKQIILSSFVIKSGIFQPNIDELAGSKYTTTCSGSITRADIFNNN